MNKRIVSLVLLGSLNFLQANTNDEFINFALKNIHERNFHGCDDAVKKIFNIARGDDMNISTNLFKNLNDTIKLTSTFGYKNDSVYMEAEIRKKDNKCYVTQTSILNFSNSCIEYAKSMQEFKFATQNLDYTWMTHYDNNTNMILKPIGNNCLVIYNINWVN